MQPDVLRAELRAALDRAAAGQRQLLTTCHESDLVIGARLRVLDGTTDDAELRALTDRIQKTLDGGGPLADVITLGQHRRRQVSFVVAEPITPNPLSVTTFTGITVLEPDAEIVLVVTASAPGGADDSVDLPVRVELMRTAELVDHLLALAYREPVSVDEAAATPGTQTSFTGPDRKAAHVTSRLVHEWEGKGVLHAWSYDLTARRTERDWVGRKPMTIKYRKAEFYAKHLRKRLTVTGPAIDG